MQVAEEHQLKAFAQVAYRQCEYRFAVSVAPVLEAAPIIPLVSQLLQQLCLARGGLRQLRREGGADLGLGQQAEQLLQAEFGRRIHPAQRLQRLRGDIAGADFGIAQPAGAEQLSPAHHHAHQQGSGCLRQVIELTDEFALGRNQQVIVAYADPVQCGLEIVEVVERIFQGLHRNERLPVLFICTW